MTSANDPRYRLLGVIGSGGMGTVYKAEHLLMGRTVALKVIHRNLTDNPAAIERFPREVRAAARLSHPNIVTAYDADQASGLHFLVMEYVEGKTLDRVLAEQGPVPVTLACDWIRQVALGLRHAHERGMVHRDIKPHNLMLTTANPVPGGPAVPVVKVMDFGLARLAHEGASEAGLTAENALIGTADYIAPEQVQDAHHADS